MTSEHSGRISVAVAPEEAGSGFVGMVLAAGLGTRLAPFTHVAPKPLFPVFDVTLLELAIGSLVSAGIREIVVNAYHLAAQIERAVSDCAARMPEVQFHVSVEPELMGTGGGVAYASRHFGDRDVVVVNGDVVARWDVAGLCRAHRRWNAAATIAVESGEAHPSLRTTRVDAQGVVREITGEALREAGWGLFSGLYILSPEAYALLPVRPCSVVSQAINPLVAGGGVRGVVSRFPWCDLGTWERLWGWTRQVMAGHPEWEFVRFASPGRFAEVSGDDRGEGFEGPIYLGPGALIEGKAGAWSVLGAGSVVGRGAEVLGSLILPGVRVEGASIAKVVGNGWSHCLP